MPPVLGKELRLPAAVTKLMKPIYLRLSVTDRCNLRCSYCWPAGGMAAAPPELDDAALIRLVGRISRIAPICKLRLTGGEPLLRPELASMTRAFRSQLPGAELCLTTNGLLLARHADGLREAGLDRVNVSLDTDDDARFEALSGGKVAHVVRGIAAARRAGFEVRINAVLMRTKNGDRLPALVRLAASHGCEIRFIELMPMGAASTLFPRDYLPAAEALARLGRVFPYRGRLGRRGTATRHLLSVGGRDLVIGMITPVSAPMCFMCNRLRLDSRGRLYACLRHQTGRELHAQDDAGLRRLLRSGLERRDMATWPDRSMAATGG